jgi:RimJ/RimL family protein N-acetyltransferase
MSDPLPVGSPLPEFEPAALPRRQRYGSDSISLVPLEAKKHGPELFAATSGEARDDALWTYLPYGPFEREADMLSTLESLESSRDPLFFAVIDNASAAALGMVSFLNIVPAMGRVELGHIWYAPSYQRGTTNTAVLLLLLTEAFDQAGNRRVEWKCNSLNARSRRAALRLGFHYEGIFRQHLVVKGKNRDTAWFSMLDSEWPQVKAGMQRWLAWEGPERPSLSTLIS